MEVRDNFQINFRCSLKFDLTSLFFFLKSGILGKQCILVLSASIRFAYSWPKFLGGKNQLALRTRPSSSPQSKWFPMPTSSGFSLRNRHPQPQ